MWLQRLCRGPNSSLFLAGLWWSWCWMNNFIFNEEKWDVDFVVRNILCLSEEIEDMRRVGDLTDPKNMWWSSPPPGFLKLNVDGSYCGHNRAMYTGGVLRDSSGTWIYGCSSKEGGGTVLRVVHLLHLELIPESAPDKDLLLEIRNMLQKNWDVSLAHVLREANSVTDYLAKGVVAMAKDFTLWDAPPLGALPLLKEDCLF
ncbi:Reverse transcriptase-like [Sesbania bispinosa]|nr:Reverse transcriptase-like [Sesbania bispinosa]